MSRLLIKWPDPAELLDRAQERVVELVQGAEYLEVDGFERIGPLTRYHYEVQDHNKQQIARVSIDVYPDEDDELIAEIVGISAPSPIWIVYTSREAARLWGLSENTVTQWCNRRRFLPSEARKSEKTWIVSHTGMVRLTGREPDDESRKN